jgi:hypothetical protein
MYFPSFVCDSVWRLSTLRAWQQTEHGLLQWHMQRHVSF